ncbi:MAG TPA: hypothetical protein VEB66_02535 [Opitutaceae bacterium]|nr:hypothetical protein [Opitutaceae bacterium]
MGIETILLVFGVILVVALLTGFARGRRRRSPTEPVARGDQPRPPP